MRVRLVFVGLLFLPGARVLGATPEDVLRTAWKDPRLSLHEEAKTLADDARSLNPLSKTELRVDQGDLKKPDDLKWGLRLYPKGPSEFRRGLRFQEALAANERAAHDEALSLLLSSRYQLVARAALLKEKMQLAAELKKVTERAHKAMAYAAQKNRAELKSFLKNKADLEKTGVKIADTERDHRYLERELRALGIELNALDLGDLASIGDLRLRQDLATAPGQRSFTAQIAEKDFEKSRRSFDFERAREDRWLEHVEITVQDDKLEKVYGVGVAFNLPFAAGPDLERVEKQTGELRERAKLAQTVAEADRVLHEASVELRTLFDVHRMLTDERPRLSAEQLRKAAPSIAAQDPLLAVELERSWIESREQILDLEFRIRSLLIVYLHESGRLAADPEQNVLSKMSKRIR